MAITPTPGDDFRPLRLLRSPYEPGALGAKASEVTHNVDVNGTGKLTVDVNAPRGTKVKAEGDGLFQKVEMNRNLSARPASQRQAVEQQGDEE